MVRMAHGALLTLLTISTVLAQAPPAGDDHLGGAPVGGDPGLASQLDPSALLDAALWTHWGELDAGLLGYSNNPLVNHMLTLAVWELDLGSLRPLPTSSEDRESLVRGPLDEPGDDGDNPPADPAAGGPAPSDPGGARSEENQPGGATPSGIRRWGGWIAPGDPAAGVGGGQGPVQPGGPGGDPPPQGSPQMPLVLLPEPRQESTDPRRHAEHRASTQPDTTDLDGLINQAASQVIAGRIARGTDPNSRNNRDRSVDENRLRGQIGLVLLDTLDGHVLGPREIEFLRDNADQAQSILAAARREPDGEAMVLDRRIDDTACGMIDWIRAQLSK